MNLRNIGPAQRGDFFKKEINVNESSCWLVIFLYKNELYIQTPESFMMHHFEVFQQLNRVDEL